MDMSLRGDLVLGRSSLLITGDCFVGKTKNPPRNDIMKINDNAIFVERMEDTIRIISARRATKDEIKDYEKNARYKTS